MSSREARDLGESRVRACLSSFRMRGDEEIGLYAHVHGRAREGYHFGEPPVPGVHLKPIAGPFHSSSSCSIYLLWVFSPVLFEFVFRPVSRNASQVPREVR